MKLLFKSLLVLGCIALLLAACSSAPTETPTPNVEATALNIAETMAADLLTSVAKEQPTATRTLAPTPTLKLVITPAATDFTSSGVCLEASLSSETIPDNTQFSPGEPFTKIWWITNLGDCAWTEDYSVVFDRGQMLGAPEISAFPGWVSPGESIPIALDMRAPLAPGTYTGFWKFQSPDGVYFGVGANGGIPVWVTIVVPSPTSIPVTDVRDFAAQSGGSVRSDGSVDFDMMAGDNAAGQGLQGFTTFSFGNLSPQATVVSVALDLDQGYKIKGKPFEDLGCLRVYLQYYGGLDSSDYVSGSPGIPLWTFCSEADLALAASRNGGADAIQAVQDALASGGGIIQFRFQFDNATDGDAYPDSFTFFPYLKVEYSLP